jgi:hypothetical protein
MEIDLNVDLLNTDMQEVIINPVAAPVPQDGNALADNNMRNIAEEKVIQIVGNNQNLDLNGPLAALEQQLFQDDHPEFPHLNFPIEPCWRSLSIKSDRQLSDKKGRN